LICSFARQTRGLAFAIRSTLTFSGCRRTAYVSPVTTASEASHAFDSGMVPGLGTIAPKRGRKAASRAQREERVMKVRAFVYALSIGATAALLAGCGSSGNAGSVMPALSAPDHKLTHSKTFAYTGTRQSFRVPAGLTKLTIIAVGAAGGGTTGGFGGRVWAVIPVTPGERLGVYVGETGSRSSGGFNGGAVGGQGFVTGCGCDGFGGGGASDIRRGGDEPTNRIIVVGGGGGDGGSFLGKYDVGGVGGKGGHSIGGAGSCGSRYTYHISCGSSIPCIGGGGGGGT
jgi:hypothetical protein